MAGRTTTGLSERSVAVPAHSRALERDVKPVGGQGDFYYWVTCTCGADCGSGPRTSASEAASAAYSAFGLHVRREDGSIR
jgi:hypothetical protein